MSQPEFLTAPKDVRELPEYVRGAWERGERKLLEELCGADRLPGLSGPDLLDLVYEEFLARKRIGQSPTADEYAARFPQHAASIGRLFALHQELGSAAHSAFPAGSGAVERLSLLEQAVQHHLAQKRLAVEVSELLARFPGEEQRIDQLLSAARANDDTSPVASAKETRASTDLDSPARLGEYRVVRQLGRGGMGVVYEAIHEPLGRRVALKVLPEAAAREPMLVERFQREARAAAGLQHPNIVPVYGVGVDDGQHYYAMQFVDGRPLDAVLADLRHRRNASLADGTARGDSATQPERIGTNDETRSYVAQPERAAAEKRTSVAQRRSTIIHQAGGTTTRADARIARDAEAPSDLDSTDYFRWVATLGRRVAEALAYAHGQGCIHRDIKPSNLMLDRSGTIWITDFGLAMVVDLAGLTRTGEVLGTLRYMAPEQMRGEASGVSDVYSLGITLYELVTLQPAFDDVLRGRLMDRVQREEPLTPRQLEPRLPLDLETVILKAITKETSRRYRSAAELADDLQRYLEDRPIQARRIGWSGRLVRWCRRNRAVATLAASIVGIIFGSVLLAYFLAWHYYEQRGVARTNEQRAIKSEGASLISERKALRRLQQARISEAESAGAGDRIGRRVDAVRYAKEALELTGRIEEANQRIADGDPALAHNAETGLTAEDRLRCRDAVAHALMHTDFEEVTDWPGATLPRGFSCDHKQERYALAKDGLIELREFAGHRLIASLQRAPGVSVSLSGDGRRLLVSEPGIAPNTTQLTAWTVGGEDPTPRPLLTHPEIAGSRNGRRFRFSPDGQWLLFQSPSGKAVLRELGGERRYEWEVGQVASIAFSHQSDFCSVAHSQGDNRHVLQVFRVSDGKLHKELDLKGKAFNQAFHHAWHPDRQRLVLDTNSRTASIWNINSGKQETDHRLPDRRTEGGASEFSPTGRYLTWAERGGLLQIFDMERRELLVSIPAYGRRCDWSPDERTLICSSPQENGRLRLLRMIPAENAQLVTFRSSRTASRQGMLGAWHVVASPRDPILAADLRHVVGLNAGAEVVLIDVRTVRECLSIQAPLIRPIAFRQDGSLVTCGAPTTQLWPRGDDAETGFPVLGPPEWASGETSAWPHGADREARQIAVPLIDHAEIMTVGKPESRRRIGSGNDIVSACLDPEGNWLVTGDEGLKVWDTKDGKLLHELESPSSAQIGFSPDGAFLWSIGGGSAIYRTSDWQRVGPIDATSIAFADSGKLVATGDPQGIVHLRDPSTWDDLLRIRPLGETRLLPKCFYNGELGLAVHDETAASLRLYDLAQVRAGLRELELDWNDDQSLAQPKSKFNGIMLRGRGFTELFDSLRKLEDINPSNSAEIEKRLERGIKAGPLDEPFVMECQWRLAWLLLAPPAGPERWQRGRELAEKILAIKPDHEAALIALALAQLRQGKGSDAETTLMPLLDKGDAAPFPAVFIAALVKRETKDEAATNAAFERGMRLRFLADARGDVDSLANFLGNRLEEQLGGDRTAIRLSVIRRLIEEEQTADAQLLYHMGIRSVVIYKNPTVASIALSRAIAIGGVPSDAHWFLALSWGQLERWDLAQEQAQLTVTKIPQHHGALELLGTLAARRSEWAAAEQNWQASLPGKPSRAYELALLKVWTPLVPNRADALALAEAWSFPDGAAYKSFEMRGLAFWLRGQHEQARKVLEEAAALELKRYPQNGVNGFNLLLRAHIHAEQGERERADELIGEARSWREKLGPALSVEHRALIELGEVSARKQGTRQGDF